MYTYKLPFAVINLAEIVEIYNPEVNPETGGVKVSIRFKAAGALDHYLLDHPVSAHAPASAAETMAIIAAFDKLVASWEEALQKKFGTPSQPTRLYCE